MSLWFASVNMMHIVNNTISKILQDLESAESISSIPVLSQSFNFELDVEVAGLAGLLDLLDGLLDGVVVDPCQSHLNLVIPNVSMCIFCIDGKRYIYLLM